MAAHMHDEDIYSSIRSRTSPHLEALAIAELNKLERVLDAPNVFHFNNPLAGSRLSLVLRSFSSSEDNLSMSLPNLNAIPAADEQCNEMTMEDQGETNEVDEVQDTNNKAGTNKDSALLDEIEMKFEQLDKILGQFNKLEQAKTIAMEQAKQALQKHTAKQVEKLQQMERKLLGNLEKRHTRDIRTITATQSEFQESLDVLKDTLASVYTGFTLKHFSQNQRDSGYSGSDTEAYETSPATSKDTRKEQSRDTGDNSEQKVNRRRISEQVSVRLDDMLNQVPNVVWTQRTVVQFVSGSNVPRLGAFKECFMSPDYSHVTKLKAYSLDEDLLVVERPSISTLRRRAKSEMSLYNGGEELSICSLSPTLFLPDPKQSLAHPTVLYHLSQVGSYPGGIHNPVDATFLPNGNLLVAEYGNGRLQEFDTTGTSVTLFDAGTKPPVPKLKLGRGGSERKFLPQGVTITKEGYVAATDGAGHNIEVFARGGGEPICTFGAGYFKDPSAIAEYVLRDTYLVLDNRGPWQHCVFLYNAMSGEKKRVGYMYPPNSHSDNVVNRNHKPVNVNHQSDNDQDKGMDKDSGVVNIHWRKPSKARTMRKKQDDEGERSVNVKSQPEYVCVDKHENVNNDSDKEKDKQKDSGVVNIHWRKPSKARTMRKKQDDEGERGVNVISQPEYVCVDKHEGKSFGNILVSDSVVHCVWVFGGPQLELLFRMGKDEEDPEHNLSHPKGICFDNEDNILVADCANHRIAKFSPEGKFLGVALDSRDGLNYPQVVQASKEGKLAVVGNSEVLVFQT